MILTPMATISGVITAMVTPFDERGAVDIDAGRELARYLIEHGSHGVVVNGTTGESPTTDDQEKLELLRAVIDEIGGEAAVIAGSGSNDTAHAIRQSERYGVPAHKLLHRAGKRKLIGGQEDQLIDIALEITREMDASA